MRTGERLILLIIGVCILILAGINILHLRRLPAAQAALPPPRLLQMKAQALISADLSYLGDVNAPYTLVEFADYQCPPCRAQHPRIADFLAQYPHRLRFTFRNLPLESIHHLALPAAIAAEAAHSQGEFWPVHEALFAQPQRLTKEGIAAIPRDFHLDQVRYFHDCATSAKAKVADDVKMADTLDLQGTPSFLLCCPDKRVLLLSSLDQMLDYVH